MHSIEVVAGDVEGGVHVIGGDDIVEDRVAQLAQQGAVDLALAALLVMVHEVEQGGVVVAGDARCAIVLAHKCGQAMQVGAGKLQQHVRQHSLGDQTPCYSIAMRHWSAVLQ